MSLQELNTLQKHQLTEGLTRCCGSSAWVEKMASLFPFDSEPQLFETAQRTWYECNTNDWLEAFTHHPKIGDFNSLQQKFASTADWTAGEQAAVKQTSLEVLEALSGANRIYEEKFGFIFIVCATGKSAGEMLQLLQSRLHNERPSEIKIAMEEQNKITKLRLQKLLQS